MIFSDSSDISIIIYASSKVLPLLKTACYKKVLYDKVCSMRMHKNCVPSKTDFIASFYLIELLFFLC